MSTVKWKSKANKLQAEAHWETVPDYPVANESDRKVDEHPHKGAAIYD